MITTAQSAGVRPDHGQVCARFPIGLVTGPALALVGADLARSLVFAVEPQDLRLVGLAAAVLATVGLAASYLPARRAARVEPLAALRAD